MTHGAQKNETLRPIPTAADLVFSSQTEEEGRLGFPAVELFVMDADGKSVTRLTHDGWTHNHFAVAPGRRFVAANRYAEDSNGDGRLDFRDKKTLWILDLQKGEEWFLVPELDAGWGGIDWSPDGEWVYASMSEPGRMGRTDVYRIRPDGSDLQNLTEGIESRLWPGASGKAITDCGVSPDGDWMCFLFSPRLEDGHELKSRIGRSRIDGSDAHLITDGGPLPPGMRGPWSVGDFDPEFSPDGRHIVFERVTDVAYNYGFSSGDIMRIRVDGEELERLTPRDDPALKGIPHWSHDDRIVYFEVDERNRFVGPVTMHGDGSDRRRITDVRGTHFRWLPPM